jgi:predicted aspartyl protease
MLPTRRLAATGLLTLAGAGFLPMVAARAQTPGVETPDAKTPDIPDEPATQVDTGRSRFEHMLAPVTINGQGPFNFLLDTGANISCVSHRLADQLGLEAGPPARVHTVVGAQMRPSVVIRQLQIGSRNRRAVSAPSLPINGSDADGVLGVDWLKGQRLVLGFKTRSLEITTSRHETSAEGRIVVPARRRMGQLTIVDADLSGRRVSAMVDSGSQVTMCNAPLRRLVKEIEGRNGGVKENREVKLESVAGEMFTGELMYLPFMRLGGLHLGNVPTVYADVHVFDIWGLKDTPALLLGIDLLTQFESVALDFGKSQVRFDIA